MTTFISKLFGWMAGGQAPKGRQPQTRRVQLSVEDLERRDTPSGGVSLEPEFRSLQLGATSQGDQFEVRIDNKGTTTKLDDVVKVYWIHTRPWLPHHVLVSDRTFTFKLWQAGAGQQVKSIYFHGGDGNDTVHNFTNLPSIMWGGKGADKLFGGGGHDEIHGNEGNDEIHGGADADDLYGTEGSDTLFGDDGNDHLYAFDPLYYNPDPHFAVDHLNGGKGEDVLMGGRGGMNVLHGGDNADVLLGGRSAQNYLFGDAGDDYLGGGRGESFNYLNGGLGADVLQGDGYGLNILDAGQADGRRDELHAGQDVTKNIWYLGDLPGSLDADTYVWAAKDYASPPHT